jgi:hypothetical protein
METTVQHDKSHHRFLVACEGATALLLYKEEGDTLYFIHTEVPPEMEGKGIGGQASESRPRLRAGEPSEGGGALSVRGVVSEAASGV